MYFGLNSLLSGSGQPLLCQNGGSARKNRNHFGEKQEKSWRVPLLCGILKIVRNDVLTPWQRGLPADSASAATKRKTALHMFRAHCRPQGLSAGIRSLNPIQPNQGSRFRQPDWAIGQENRLTPCRPANNVISLIWRSTANQA